MCKGGGGGVKPVLLDPIPRPKLLQWPIFGPHESFLIYQ